MSPKLVTLPALAMAMSLGACDTEIETPDVPNEGEGGGETSTPISTPPPEPVSILRPGVEEKTEKPMEPTEVMEAEEAILQNYSATVGFPEGGSDLDVDAIAVLEQIQATPQFGQTGAIVIRAHSDSAGSDAANERAAEARGLAVAEWLIAAGAEPRRIDVIVFGEQNPIEPNALPDGSPNEQGRAVNRRVAVEILATPSASPSDPPAGPSSQASDER